MTKRLVVQLLERGTAKEIFAATLADDSKDADVEYLLRVAADRVKVLGVNAAATMPEARRGK